MPGCCNPSQARRIVEALVACCGRASEQEQKEIQTVEVYCSTGTRVVSMDDRSSVLARIGWGRSPDLKGKGGSDTCAASECTVRALLTRAASEGRRPHTWPTLQAKSGKGQVDMPSNAKNHHP